MTRAPEKPALFPAWAYVLCLACCLWSLARAPVNSVLLNYGSDALEHFSAIQGASQALAEGQVPLREIPRVMVALPPVYGRYALFQFYAPLPLALGGLLVLGGLNPWHAFLALVFLASAAGFLGIFKLARETGGSQAPAVAAGLIYTLAPYHLTLFSYRAALPELWVVGLLPWVVLGVWNCCRKTGPAPVLASGLAWAALMHTHHVFHAWTLPFVAVLLAWWRAAGKATGAGLGRAGAGYLIGLALSLWFVVPGAFVGRHFAGLTPEFVPPNFAADAWYTFKTLIAHAWICGPLGLQGRAEQANHLGWPLLAGVLFFIWRRGRQGLKQPFFWLFLAAFLMACFAAFYWNLLGPFKMIQNKYRLLAFATLFGSLAAGQGLEGLPRRQAWLALALLFAGTSFLHFPYQKTEAVDMPLDRLRAAGQTYGVQIRHVPYAYVIPESEAESMGIPDLELASSKDLKQKELGGGVAILSPAGFPSGSFNAGRWSAASLAGVEPGSLALLPAPWYPGLYRMEINGKKVEYGRVGNRLAVALPQGGAELRYKLAGIGWANAVSLAAWILFFAWAGLKKWRKQS